MNKRLYWLDLYTKVYADFVRMFKDPVKRELTTRRVAAERNISLEEAVQDAATMLSTLGVITYGLRMSQTILFSTEQLKALQHQELADPDEYKLPFPAVLLQLTEPLPVTLNGMPEKIVGFILTTTTMTEGDIEGTKALFKRVGGSPVPPKGIHPGNIYHTVVTLFSDEEVELISWSKDRKEEIDQHYKPDVQAFYIGIKKLIINCVAYINSENVRLEKEGEVPEKVNRKRLKKDKAPIEPYYICRIRKDGYTEGPHAHTGIEHGHRYDVRGHYRHLRDGRTIWIKQHQRGLKHDIYIPKTYYVGKERTNG